MNSRFDFSAVALLTALSLLCVFRPLGAGVLEERSLPIQDDSRAQDAGTQADQQADDQQAEAQDVFRDEFDDGEFDLEWKVIRKNEVNVSLGEHSDELTIFTERGSINKDQDNNVNNRGGRAKNLHLLQNTLDEDDKWQITTCLVEFVPTTNYHQAGLLIWDDDENYVKCVIQQGRNGSMLRLAEEANMVYTTTQGPYDPRQDKIWLRLVREGETYTCFTSYDGEEFKENCKINWTGKPSHVGLIAKNGGNINAPTVEARFEFFEFKKINEE